jgi:hypothetical protein
MLPLVILPANYFCFLVGDGVYVINVLFLLFFCLLKYWDISQYWMNYNSYTINSILLKWQFNEKITFFIKLWNCHHYLVPEHFCHWSEDSYRVWILPPLYSLATANLLSVSMESSIVNTNTEGIIQYVAFCIWLLPLGIYFKLYPCCTFTSNSLHFVGEQYSIVRTHHILSLCRLMDIRTVSTFVYYE